jgi:hypothetical protein
MNAPEKTRQELLDAIAELSRLRPHWRLGQTLANLAMTAGRVEASGVWDLEDDEALIAAKALLKQDAEMGRDVA